MPGATRTGLDDRAVILTKDAVGRIEASYNHKACRRCVEHRNIQVWAVAPKDRHNFPNIPGPPLRLPRLASRLMVIDVAGRHERVYRNTVMQYNHRTGVTRTFGVDEVA